MRKTNLFRLLGILTIMPLSLISCSDDDDGSGPGSSSKLIGTWEMTQTTIERKEDGKTVYESTSYDNNTRLTFAKEGTYRETGYKKGEWDWEKTGKWSYKSGKLTVDRTIEGDDGEEKYTQMFTVKTLTSSKLVYEFVHKYKDDGTFHEEYTRVEYRKVSSGNGNTDDGYNPNPPSPLFLTGTWEKSSYTYKYFTNGIVTQEVSKNENDTRLTFNDDGTYKAAEYLNGEWYWNESGKWTYKNGKLTVNGTRGSAGAETGYTRTYAVRELTNFKLVYEQNEIFAENNISYETCKRYEFRKIPD